MRRLSFLAASVAVGLSLAACGEDEDLDPGTDTDAKKIGRNAPNVIVDGNGRLAKRQELERPIEEMVDRVRCPPQAALGFGARFTCAFSDPELGTGAILVEQVDEDGTLEYSALPRSSTEFEGSFTIKP